MSFKSFLVLITCAMLVFGMVVASFADITVSVVGEESHDASAMRDTLEANLGQTFDVFIKIEGITSADVPNGIGAFEFDLTYDSTYCTIDSASVMLSDADPMNSYLAMNGRIPTHLYEYAPPDSFLPALVSITEDPSTSHMIFACATLPEDGNEADTTNGAFDGDDGYGILAKLTFTAKDTTPADYYMPLQLVADDLILTDPVANVVDADNVYEAYLTVKGTVTFTRPLGNGWNHISYNVLPDDIDFEAVLGDIFDNVTAIYNEQTFEYWTPGNPTRIDLSPYSAYWIGVDQNCIFEAIGTPIEPPTIPTPLSSGWNLVSYLPNEDQYVEDALANIIDHALAVYNPGTFEYWTENSPPGSVTMRVGDGYWLRVDEAGLVLEYATGNPVVLAHKGDQSSERVMGYDESSSKSIASKTTLSAKTTTSKAASSMRGTSGKMIADISTPTTMTKSVFSSRGDVLERRLVGSELRSVDPDWELPPPAPGTPIGYVETSNATLDGELIQVGDWVGAYKWVDGNRRFVNEYEVTVEGYVNVPVRGVPDGGDPNDGYAPGEPMYFRMFDGDTGDEYEAMIVDANGDTLRLGWDGGVPPFGIVTQEVEGMTTLMPNLHIEETAIDFGSVYYQGSRTESFMINNNGEGGSDPLEGQITVTNSSSNAQVTVSPETFTVDLNGNISIDVTVTADNAQINDPFDAELSVTSNGGAETVNISGTFVDAFVPNWDLPAPAPGTPIGYVETSNATLLGAPIQPVDWVGAYKWVDGNRRYLNSYQVTVTGYVNVPVRGVPDGGDPNDGYAPDETMYFRMFDGITGEEYEATITDANGDPITLGWDGGVPPFGIVTQEVDGMRDMQPVLETSETSLDFGMIPLSGTKQATFTISNVGEAYLTGTVASTDPANAIINITPDTFANLEASDDPFTITVEVVPDGAVDGEELSGQLTVESDGGTQAIPFTGTFTESPISSPNPAQFDIADDIPLPPDYAPEQHSLEIPNDFDVEVTCGLTVDQPVLRDGSAMSTPSKSTEEALQLTVRRDVSGIQQITVQDNDASAKYVSMLKFKPTMRAEGDVVRVFDQAGEEILPGDEITIAGSSSANLTVHFDMAALNGHGIYDGMITIVDISDGSNDYPDIEIPVEITLTGAYAELDPTTADYGLIEVGQSLAKTFDITNSGNGALVIDAITRTSGSEHFTVTSPASGDFPITLNPGDGALSVEVTFSPPVGSESANPYQAEFQIESNAYNTLDNIAVSGRAITIARLSVDPLALNFDPTLIHYDNTSTLQMTISNSDGADTEGTGELTINAVDIDNGDFTLNPAPPYTIQAGGSQVVDVIFNPSVLGDITATLMIDDITVVDSAEVTSNEVDLAGTGVEGNIQPEEAMVDFGPVITVDPPLVRDIMIANTGIQYLGSLTIESIALETGAEFTITNTAIRTFNQPTVRSTSESKATLSMKAVDRNNSQATMRDMITLPADLNPNDTLVVTVEFDPNAEEEFSDVLHVGSNDFDTPMLDIPLTGEGIQCPDFTMPDIANYDVPFADTPAHESTTETITIFNDVDADLGGTLTASLTITDNAGGLFAAVDWTEGQDYDIPAGGTMDFTISFSPVDHSEFQGVLDITTNAGRAGCPVTGVENDGQANATLTLTGTGLASDADLNYDGTDYPDISNPPVVDFGIVAFDTTENAEPVTETLTFVNSGNEPLTVSNMVLSCDCDYLAEFSIDLTSLTLAAGESGDVTIFFLPDTSYGVGARTVTLSGETNDPNAEEQTFTIEVNAEATYRGELAELPDEVTFDIPFLSNLSCEENQAANFDYELFLSNSGLPVEVYFDESDDVDWMTPPAGPIEMSVEEPAIALINISMCDPDQAPGHYEAWLRVRSEDQNGYTERDSILFVVDYDEFYTAADFNGDGFIESFDLILFLYAYGSQPGDDHWNPVVDIAGEGFVPVPDLMVDFSDLGLFSMVYGTRASMPTFAPPAPVFSSGHSYVEFQPESISKSVQIEDEIRVLIQLASENLFACQFDVTYDPTVLEYVGTNEGQLMKAKGEATFFKAISKEEGQLTISTSQLGRTAGAQGEGAIAELIFRVLAEGNTTVEISNMTTVDPHLKPIQPMQERIVSNVVISTDESKTEPITAIPSYYGISQNFPNPFNPKTSIQYQLPEKTEVMIGVYNTTGQLVKTLAEGERDAGYYTIEWNGTDDFGNAVSSGVYFYTIVAGDYTTTKRMVLLK